MDMPSVLVAEDNPSFQSLFEVWLQSCGFAVRLASDGVEALASIVNEGMPDAVVLDVNMPRLDGLELCRILRRVEPLLPVVIVSAADDLARIGRRSGASVVLAKPSTPTELSGVLRTLLSAPAATVYAA
jgi:two-component system, OmpR family, response regulator MprA